MDVASNINPGAKVSRTLLVMAGLVSLSAIMFLTWNVSREITALGTATSDNVEWSLSQTEVEYLEFARRAHLGSDLTELRRRFDVFYCASSDNLEHQRCFPFGGSGSSLIEFMRFQFGGASAA